MPYVYAVMFDSGIVKFGRSGDPFDRISKHVTDGNRYGMMALHAFYAPVVNDVREERAILDSAYDVMDAVSQESFRYDSYAQVSAVFEDCRIVPVFCKVSQKPFRLIVGPDAFVTDYSKYDTDKSAKNVNRIDDPLYKVKLGVYKALQGRDVSTFDIVRASNQSRTVKSISVAMREMEAEGSLHITYRLHPFTGMKWGDERNAKFKLTALAEKLY